MLEKHIKIFLFLILLLLIIPVSFADGNEDLLSANEVYFDSSAVNDGNGSISSPYKYLSSDRISDGSSLNFASGEYELNQSKSFSTLTITGHDRESTIIKSNGAKLTVSNSLSISNLTLNNLKIQNNGKLTINSVDFENGNGTYISRYNSIFGGSVYANSNTQTTINSATFKNCSADYGGAIYIGGNNSRLSISNSIFNDNHAYKYGGALAGENSAYVEITKSIFSNNTAVTNAGGAIYVRNANLTVSYSNITNSKATFGSAICDLKSDSKINNIIASNNNAVYAGGAIYKMYGTMEVSSSDFINNNAANGGAIYGDNSTLFKVVSSTFTNNKATYLGNAIYTVLNSNESVTGNKYGSQSDYYKAKGYDLFIGNGNYTEYVGNFDIKNLPSKYDLRDYGFVTSVKDQKSSGNCWAFTSMAALESCILKITNTSYDLSEENMKNVISYYSDYGWNLMTNDGGYDDMGVGYLVSWLGPVNEDIETFSDYSVLSPVLNSTIHVQNLIYLTRQNFTDNNGIKEAIMKYGAVATGIRYSSAYLKDGKSYYYTGNESQNHAVTIVGWDDNYSKSNFKSTPAGDGAWICKNSWGSVWGDNGYFYISYYDTKCTRLGAGDKSTYTFILNDTVHYDKNYQYDIIGITDYLITGHDTIWYENIFNATENELLVAFSTYFNTTTNWQAQIYVNSELKLTQNGVSNAGYYTINLDKFIPLKTGDTFRIVLKISADKFASFPVSEKARSNRILYSKGVSFFSTDGEKWTDLYDYAVNMTEFGHYYESQVACIKAFTSYALNTTIKLNDLSLVGLDAPFEIIANVYDEYGRGVTTGSIMLTLDDKTYTVRVNDGRAIFMTQISNSGIYTLQAQYVGNDYYSASSASTIVNASNITPKLTISISDIEYGENLTVKNTLTYGSAKVIGFINVKINDRDYYLPTNGQSVINETIKPGRYTAYADYLTVTANTTFNINRIPVTMTLSTQKIAIDSVNITIKLSKAANGTVSVNIAGSQYNVTSVNGAASLILKDVDYGNYSVRAEFKNDTYANAAASGSFTIDYYKTVLKSNKVNMYYHDGTRLVVSLTDRNNKALANQNVSITINGATYRRVTNSSGMVSLALNLNSGNYSTLISYGGQNRYLSSNLTTNVLIKTTVYGQDVVKYYRNGTQFYATVLDYKGSLVSNRAVTLNINGVFYNRTTNANGVVRLNLNLEAGHYILTTMNPVTGENTANNITVLSRLSENNDLVKYYRNASKYSVKVLSETGRALSGVNVSFNINGVFYTRTSNSEGIASLAINLEVGNYIITAEYEKSRVSNKIRVLNVIKTANLVMKYRDGSKFTATILDGQGKAYPSQNVTFNINGVLYTRTTNSTGAATLNINLQSGKYIITTSYNGLNAANTITIN